MMTPARVDTAEAANTVDDSHHEILEEYDDRRLERMAKRAAKEAGGKFITWRLITIGLDENVEVKADNKTITGLYRATAVYLRSVHRAPGVGVDSTDIRLA